MQILALRIYLYCGAARAHLSRNTDILLYSTAFYDLHFQFIFFFKTQGEDATGGLIDMQLDAFLALCSVAC